MKKIKIGLLPLYIKLYDDSLPILRERLEPFYKKMTEKLENEGFEVKTARFCRVGSEFSETVSKFEDDGVNCIVTLHMAYSPSLESVSALASTSLPIVVMDTTETYDFGFDVSIEEIDYNHGIHGVMDMCNLLRRNKKPYAIAVGHCDNSDVVRQTARLVRAAVAAKNLDGLSVGVIGGAFKGMGDFLVDSKELKKTFGIKLLEADNHELRTLLSSVSDSEVAAELAENEQKFAKGEDINEENYLYNIKACLAVRKWIEKHNLDAFSVNFLKIRDKTIDSMPFIEACKAMERGIGYAGEGDALTAAFVGAFLKVIPDTSFIEIFCPDWKNDLLFISHMAEMNYGVADGKPILYNMPFDYNDTARDTVAAYSRFKGGKAVYVNIYRDEEGFKLGTAPVEMVSVEKDRLQNQMRGWMKPEKSVPEFLKSLSEHGATHHSFLIYDGNVDMIKFFGKLIGIPVEEL